MKQTIPLLCCFFIFINGLHSQSNCQNPTTVTICPSIFLSHQTNAGMGDDAPPSCNIAGEDVLYKIIAPNGANQLFVSVANSTADMLLSVEAGSCGIGPCNSILIQPGNSDIGFPVPYATVYYLWVDAGSTVLYDISIGADTGTSFVHLPDTRGNLQFDSSGCVAVPFQNSKKFFSVSYNQVYQTDPMTLAPLFTTGSMCISAFFKNTTGVEGVKRFNFYFNPAGYASVISSPVVAGNYNSGNWIASSSGTNWTFIFYDSLGTGRGDFGGAPDSCLEYKFCFDIIPVSNDTQLTNVKVNVVSDGWGSPFNGLISTGCCPATNASCFAGENPGSNGHSFDFSFDDPAASPFPITLLNFTVEKVKENILIEWSTGSEVNSDYFTIEKSPTGNNWLLIDKIKGAGNSTSIENYSVMDQHPVPGTSYYRLKQTDFNGNSSYCGIRSVQFPADDLLTLYPNPVSDFLVVESENATNLTITLYNTLSEKTELSKTVTNNTIRLNTTNLPSGLYLLVIENPDKTVHTEKVLVQN